MLLRGRTLVTYPFKDTPNQPTIHNYFGKPSTFLHLKCPLVRSSTRTPPSAEPIITFLDSIEKILSKLRPNVYLVLGIELVISAVHLWDIGELVKKHLHLLSDPLHRQRVPLSVCKVPVRHGELGPCEPTQVPDNLQQAVLKTDSQVVVRGQVDAWSPIIWWCKWNYGRSPIQRRRPSPVLARISICTSVL